MLTSRSLKGVTNGFPLKIIVSIDHLMFTCLQPKLTSIFAPKANEVKEVNVDFNKEFIERIVPKIDWNVLSTTAGQFGVELPSEFKPTEASEELLKQVHHALLEIEVVDGQLVCPETGRKFPISQGIPNMLCNEDEV